MRNQASPGRGDGGAGPALFARMAAVLDPLATGHSGQPIAVVKTLLRRAWSEAFATELPEPTLTRCSRAIQDSTPWAEELWIDGWYRPQPSAPRRHLPASYRPSPMSLPAESS
jgi:hypothetical protein